MIFENITTFLFVLQKSLFDIGFILSLSMDNRS